jgi:hypothetical protein
VGDRLWANRSTPGGITKLIDASGEYARIFVGTVIDDSGAEGPWAVDVDFRVLPTLGELSYMQAATLADYYVPVFHSSGSWSPGILPAVGVSYSPAGDVDAADVQAAIDWLGSNRSGRRWSWAMGD